MDIDELYQLMIYYANKANQAKKDYAEQELFIEDRVRASKTDLLDEADLRRVIDSEMEKSTYLSRANGRYTHFRQEQIRLGQLLQSHQSYVELKEASRRRML